MKNEKAEAKTINRAQANEIWCEFFTRKGMGWLPVLTGSMAPMILPGDHVFITYIRAEQVNLGDVILFKRNNELVVHRVLKKWHRALSIIFLEQGDMMHAFGLISTRRIIGRVKLVRRGNCVLDLASPLSRATSRLVTIWLYLSSCSVCLLKSSRNSIIRRVGRVISKSLLIISNLLIRTCFLVWYPSGFFAMKNHKVKQKYNFPIAIVREVKS